MTAGTMNRRDTGPLRARRGGGGSEGRGKVEKRTKGMDWCFEVSKEKEGKAMGD